MLTYFPEIYPDELLYSVLGRLKCHLGVVSDRGLMMDVFNSHNVHAGVFLQTDLKELAANIVPFVDLTAEELAMETTLLPYATAYQPQKIRDWAMAALTSGHGNAGAIGSRLGVRFPYRLRYCTNCQIEMLKQQGELYWRRDHQLPGVLVCPIHGSPLADCLVPLLGTGVREYVVPGNVNCPPNPTPPLWANQPNVVELLMAISKASAGLLTTPPNARSFFEQGVGLQDSLRARGIVRGPSRIDLPTLKEKFLDLYGPIFDIVPEAAPDQWLAQIARKHRSAFAPLRYVLINRLVETLPLVESNPFGTGPWTCRNPLADHFAEPVISEFELREIGSKAIGIFRCTCGYIFSVAPEPGSKARILDHGQLFESRLRELAASETILRNIARALHVTTATVKFHLSRIGLEVPWKLRTYRGKTRRIDREATRSAWVREHTAAPTLTRAQLARKIPKVYHWLHRYDRDWLKLQPPAAITRGTNRPPMDRSSIDAETAQAIKQEAARLRAQDPPQRVSRPAIERNLGRRNCLSRRRYLPLCKKALLEVLESVEQFQRRRIIWAAEKLRERGEPISVRRLRELARLEWRCTPDIVSFLQELAES
jgi:hypothetical protein